MSRTTWMAFAAINIATASAPWTTIRPINGWIDALGWGIAAFCALQALAPQSGGAE